MVLDWDRKQIIDQVRFEHTVYEQSHKGFTGASRVDDGRVLVATEAEIVEIDVAPLRVAGTKSFHFLNDVHHVACSADRFWICNTGLDCIEEFDRSWQHLKTHHLVRRFGRGVSHVIGLLRSDLKKSWRRWSVSHGMYDHLTTRPPFRNVVKLVSENHYRRNGRELRFSDFRPHVLHPNHVLVVENDLWVTLWSTGEIVSLTTGEVLFSGLGRPHDGVQCDEEFYVTDCQSNSLCVYPFPCDRTKSRSRTIRQTVTGELSEGFLRGVCAVGDSVFVGLSARRGAPLQQRHARVVMLDRSTLQPREEWEVPSKYGKGLFSIINVERAYA